MECVLIGKRRLKRLLVFRLKSLKSPARKNRHELAFKADLVLVHVGLLAALEPVLTVDAADVLPGVLHHESSGTRIDGFERIGDEAVGNARTEEGVRIVDCEFRHGILGLRVPEPVRDEPEALGKSAVLLGEARCTKPVKQVLVGLGLVEAREQPVHAFPLGEDFAKGRLFVLIHDDVALCVVDAPGQRAKNCQAGRPRHCTVHCRSTAPAAIEMKPQESQAAQQAAFDYCVENIRKKDNIPGVVSDISVKGSQFNQPLLEFSGSCAGCAETSYARLITQLFGEKMFISNATGCSSIWGGTASISPYTTNKESGFGPAWINSLFEDNAEHGLGMQIGYETVRANLITKVEALKGKNADLDAVIDKYLETKNNTKANDAPAKALIAALEACGCDEAKEILKDKQYLAKKSFWIFGGDGWAYDIGYGGLDHVLASGHDVNVMVFDTEMYSNTGGQASKASNIGEVCQFAAAGKEIGKKSLSEIAMQYGYVYVAQIALGANMAQAVKVLAEAEAYDGPSLIIGYAPCELHGIAKGGMNHCQDEMKKAVKAGYWNLFSFNPALKAEGKNPFTLTSKAGDGSYQEFLNNEARYTRLIKPFPERAEKLFAKSEETAKARYTHLEKLVKLYGED